jgi:hypothetical protein
MAIRTIALIYAMFGAAAASVWLYSVLFVGTRSGSSTPFDAIIPFALAYGLATFRPWARILGLLVTGFLGFVGVLGLIMCVGHVAGHTKAATGLIVDNPVLAFVMVGLLIAFAGFQWWALAARPGRDLFVSRQTQPVE